MSVFLHSQTYAVDSRPFWSAEFPDPYQKIADIYTDQSVDPRSLLQEISYKYPPDSFGVKLGGTSHLFKINEISNRFLVELGDGPICVNGRLHLDIADAAGRLEKIAPRLFGEITSAFADSRGLTVEAKLGESSAISSILGPLSEEVWFDIFPKFPADEKFPLYVQLNEDLCSAVVLAQIRANISKFELSINGVDKSTSPGWTQLNLKLGTSKIPVHFLTKYESDETEMHFDNGTVELILRNNSGNQPEGNTVAVATPRIRLTEVSESELKLEVNPSSKIDDTKGSIDYHYSATSLDEFFVISDIVTNYNPFEAAEQLRKDYGFPPPIPQTPNFVEIPVSGFAGDDKSVDNINREIASHTSRMRFSNGSIIQIGADLGDQETVQNLHKLSVPEEIQGPINELLALAERHRFRSQKLRTSLPDPDNGNPGLRAPGEGQIVLVFSSSAENDNKSRDVIQWFGSVSDKTRLEPLIEAWKNSLVDNGYPHVDEIVNFFDSVDKEFEKMSGDLVRLKPLISQPMLYGSAPLEDGVLEIPFLNLTEQIYLDSVDVDVVDGATKRTLSGACIWNNSDDSIQYLKREEHRWNMALTDCESLQGAWNLEKQDSGWSLNSINLKLANPELVLNGVVNLLSEPVSKEDIVP